MKPDVIGVDIFSGRVVVHLTATLAVGGNFQWTYRFARRDEPSLGFAEADAEDIGLLMTRVFHWISENDASEFVSKYMPSV